MKFISKIQKFFCTDKWLGRLYFFVVFYILYIFWGYWIWFTLVKVNILDYSIFTDSFIFSVYLLFLLPLFSFFLAFKIKKVFNIKISSIVLFFINLIIILVNLLMFINYSASSFLTPNFF